MITRKNIIVTYNINFLEGVLKTPSGGAENHSTGILCLDANISAIG